jgi:hypothetical protein
MKYIEYIANVLFDEEVTQADFDRLTYQYFAPNPYSRENKIEDKEMEKKKKQLNKVITYLKKDGFHEQFSTWINFESIWNFHNQESKMNLFDKIYKSHASNLEHLPIDKIIIEWKNIKTFDEVFKINIYNLENEILIIFMKEFCVKLNIPYNKNVMFDLLQNDSIDTNTGNISQSKLNSYMQGSEAKKIRQNLNETLISSVI